MNGFYFNKKLMDRIHRIKGILFFRLSGRKPENRNGDK